MSFITYSILLTSLLLGLLVSLNVRAEEGNTTYNFYFQKAPGPVTVNQGGAPAAPTQLVPAASVPAKENGPPAAAQPTSTSTVEPEEATSQKKFFLSLGYAYTAGYGGQPTRYEQSSGKANEYPGRGQFAIRAEYDLSDRITGIGELYKLTRQIGSDGNVVDFGLGAAYRLFGSRTSNLGLTLGLLTVPSFNYKTGSSEGGARHETALFGGLRGRVMLGNTWGLEVSARGLLGIRQAVGQVGLTFAI